jgi:5-methylcytosine-specific restriction endonuclease McrA
VQESTVEMRKCKRCQTEKELTKVNFAPRKFKDTQYFDGICRSCWNEYRKDWMRKNRQRYAAKEARRYEVNKERISAHNKQRYRIDVAFRLAKSERGRKRNASLSPESREILRKKAMEKYYRDLDKKRAYAKKMGAVWRRRHPEQVRLAAKRRKAMRRGAQVETITKKQIEELFAKQRGRCAICASKIDMATKHIDHIVAIAKGGKHEILNLQLTCPRCNMTKQAKDPIDFMQTRGYLL